MEVIVLPILRGIKAIIMFKQYLVPREKENEIIYIYKSFDKKGSFLRNEF